MDPILEFPVGQDDPIEIIPINCAQLILFDMIDKARANSMRLVRKLSRHEVLNVGRPGNKVAVQLQSELLTKAPLHPIQTSVASSSKGDPPSLKAKRTSKSKPEKANLPGNVYAHMAQPCQLCGCKRVRVVNTGRLDGRNIMECTNRDCLATIKFTLVPAGTLINPGGTPEEFSWYDLDPEDIFYPSALTLKRIEESILSSPRQPFIPKMRYDEQGSIVVRCPGQKELVKLL